MKRTNRSRAILLTPRQFQQWFGISGRALARWRALGLPTARLADRTRYPKDLCITWLFQQARRGSPPWRPAGPRMRRLG